MGAEQRGASERIVLHVPVDFAPEELAGLCRRFDCVGRRAAFDRAEYLRIFGAEP